LHCRGVPVPGEPPVDTHRPASLVLSEDTMTFLDRPGEASVAPEKQIDEQTALSERHTSPLTTEVISVALKEGDITDCSFLLFSLLFAFVADFPPIRTNVADHVTFAALPSAPESDRTEAEAFAFELFGELNQPSPTAAWTPVMLSTIKSEVRSGLKDELRNNLLAGYEPKENLSFLAPPKVNKKILPNLAAAALARDKHQMQSQVQLEAALNAIGSDTSGLIGLELFQSSVEGKSAVSKISDGVHFLADLHFRLSQSRRAFIIPSLNFLGKTASDAAPIDDCLFGNNFRRYQCCANYRKSGT